MIPEPDLRIAVGYLFVMKLGFRCGWPTSLPVRQAPWYPTRRRDSDFAGSSPCWTYATSAPFWSGSSPPPGCCRGSFPFPPDCSGWGPPPPQPPSSCGAGPVSRESTCLAGEWASRPIRSPSGGPYRWVRYPCEICDAAFYVSTAWVTGNGIVLVAAAAVTVAVRLTLIPRMETGRRAAWGPVYDSVAKSTGILLPVLGPKSRREYTVPKRFWHGGHRGPADDLRIVFGVLKYWQTHPVVYLFVASEIAAICLAQIVFGSAPRIGSIATGAVLLPLWVSLTVDDRLLNLHVSRGVLDRCRDADRLRRTVGLLYRRSGGGVLPGQWTCSDKSCRPASSAAAVDGPQGHALDCPTRPPLIRR